MQEDSALEAFPGSDLGTTLDIFLTVVLQGGETVPEKELGYLPMEGDL